MDIRTVANSEFYDLLNKYSEDPANRLGNSAEQFIRSLDNTDCIVPVLGMQGMGKSTLINAVLGENILPNDADETTCVPVEVKYGEKEYAEVFINGTDKNPIVNSIEELAEYVDNNQNPGNEKRVSHIVLYRKREILKSGITIVDLPGVGSLTHENEETTMHYIKNLCTAIFVIPTVPTIRKSECAFIKGVWSQFPTMMFVQNLWGESKREAKESVEFNSKLLKKLASETNAKFDNDILTVNAHDALTGAIRSNDELVRESGLSALTERIRLVSGDWEKQLYDSVVGRLVRCVYSAKLVLKKRMDKLALDQKSYEEKRRLEQDEFRKTTREITRVADDIRSYLDTAEGEMFDFTSASAKETAGKIRSEVYRLIDSGVTDGDDLSEAFQQIQSDKIADYSDDCLTEFAKIQATITRKLESIEEIILDEEEFKFNNAFFDKAEGFKGEKIASFAVGVGGVVGGYVLGSSVSSLVGSLAALGSAAGPVGAIAGLVAGFAITIVGGLLGSLIKKTTRKGRANATKNEISPQIDQLERSIKKSVRDRFSDMKEHVNLQLDTLLSNRKSEEKAIFENINDISNEYSAEELESDLTALNKTGEEIEKCLTN